MPTLKIFDWLRKASRIISRMSDAPTEVRDVYNEASQRFAARHDQNLGLTLGDRELHVVDFVRILKEVAIERGVDIQRWLNDVLRDGAAPPTDAAS
jgi:siderophore synthetase component